MKIWKGGPKNVPVIEGEGVPSPVIEICETRPLFQIQRGYLLALRNIRIEYKEFETGLFLEASGHSFFPDPDNVCIVGVSKCCGNSW